MTKSMELAEPVKISYNFCQMKTAIMDMIRWSFPDVIEHYVVTNRMEVEIHNKVYLVALLRNGVRLTEVEGTKYLKIDMTMSFEASESSIELLDGGWLLVLPNRIVTNLFALSRVKAAQQIGYVIAMVYKDTEVAIDKLGRLYVKVQGNVYRAALNGKGIFFREWHPRKTDSRQMQFQQVSINCS